MHWLPLLWALSAGPAAAAPLAPLQPAPLTPEIARRLTSGEIVHQEEHLPEGKVRLVARFYVPATPGAVYEILADNRGLPELVPSLESVRVLGEAPTGALIEYHFHQVLHYTYTALRTYDPPSRIQYHELFGDLRQLEGVYEIEPGPGGKGTFLTNRIYIDPGRFVPDFLARYIEKHGAPEFVANMKRRIVSGGTWNRNTPEPKRRQAGGL